MAREEDAFLPDRERSMAAGGSRSSELEKPTILERQEVKGVMVAWRVGVTTREIVGYTGW